MTCTRLSPVLLVALALGCGGSKHSSADVERGQKALTAALDGWKNNEPADRLKALPDPVEYTDELRRTHKLVDYTLGKPNTTDPAVLRYPVTLKLQDRKGKAQDRDVVFEVKLGNPIVIARDPYE
jgi:hypothetical protein